jgi:GAF domain-containing protein/ANTAR domain-containing protein
MDERERWAALLAEASAERADQPQRICELSVELLGMTGAGISLVTESGNQGIICATDDVSSRIEDLQLTLGEGPCVDAVSSGAPVLVPDLGEAGDLVVERWPTFLREAEGAGVRAVFALPLRIGAIMVGALDLYRDQPGGLVGGQLPGALMAADAAAHALLYLDRDRDDSFRDDVEARSSYRMQVHQATGMVQVQLGVSTEEAFLMLRARAFADGRSLADTATDVVARSLRFSPEDQ